jgi:hypothetical protein
MMMTLFVLEFSVQSAQLTSHMHPQRPTNHVLNTYGHLGPTCHEIILVYIRMPKNLALYLDKSLEVF